MATLGPIRSINLGTRLRGWEILREEVTRHRKLPTEGHRGVSCRILILRATSALSPWAVRPSQAALHSGLSVLRLVKESRVTSGPCRPSSQTGGAAACLPSGCARNRTAGETGAEISRARLRGPTSCPTLCLPPQRT